MFGARITFRQSVEIVLFLALRSRRQSMGDPFSLQSKQLQPDYVSRAPVTTKEIKAAIKRTSNVHSLSAS